MSFAPLRVVLLFPALLFALSAGADSLKPARSTEPVERTQCDPSLPIRVELISEGEPRVGQTTRFLLLVDSNLDPDLVQDMRVEYETPSRLQLRTDFSREPQALAKSGRTQMQLSVLVPDEARYSIRARLVVRLVNGKTISQTAVRWIDLGVEDPPEGMIGRIVNPDGTGIRVYQGTTVRTPR